jgi:hypothetical protein
MRLDHQNAVFAEHNYCEFFFLIKLCPSLPIRSEVKLEVIRGATTVSKLGGSNPPPSSPPLPSLSPPLPFPCPFPSRSPAPFRPVPLPLPLPYPLPSPPSPIPYPLFTRSLPPLMASDSEPKKIFLIYRCS